MEPLKAEDPRSVGEFRLRARLGAGGMGRVYLGMSPAGRAVAVKVVHPRLACDGEFIRRFRAEVAAAQAVNGIYTAQVVAAGLYDDPPWLATAYVPGPTLDELIVNGGPLPSAALWRLAAGLAEALQAVHATGLVHRDLKPTNVLIAEDGPRVIDFGVSRALDGTAATQSGMAVGTPPFMSPEQAQGVAVGPPSDVFALGSVLCFAASGKPPFGAENAFSVLYCIVHERPSLTGVPDDLRDIVGSCLAKDPAARPGLASLTARFGELAGLTTALFSDWDGTFWPPDVTTAIRGHGSTRTQSPPAGTPVVDAPARTPGFDAPPPTAYPRAATPAAPAWPPAAVRAPGADGSPFAVGPATAAGPPTAVGSPFDTGTTVAAGSGAVATGPISPSPALSRRRALAVFGGVGVAGLAATAGWLLSARTSPRHPAAAASHPAGLTGARPAGQDRVLWRKRIGARVSHVAAGDGVVAIGTLADDVRAFKSGGTHLWTMSPDHSPRLPVRGLAVVGSVVVVLSDQLTGYDARSGDSQPWAYGGGSSGLLAATAPYCAYDGHNDGGWFVGEASTVRGGSGSRHVMPGTTRPTALAGDNGAFYIGSDTGRVTAIAADVPFTWTRRTPVRYVSGLAAGHGYVYGHGTDPHQANGPRIMFALDEMTGHVLWQIPDKRPRWVVAGDGTAYFSGNMEFGGSVNGIEACGGAVGQGWYTGFAAELSVAPVLDDVLVACTGQVVHGIDTDGGAISWTQTLPSRVTALAAGGGIAYVATAARDLYAIQL